MKKLIGDGFLQLKQSDILKGFITAVMMVLVTYAGQCLSVGNFPTDKATWVLELKFAFGAGLGYLLKNFFTNSDGKFLKSENKDA